MASPTRATIETAWKNAIKLFDQTYRYGSVNANNVVTLVDTLEQSLEGDFVDEAVFAANQFRAQIAGAVTRASAQTLFRPYLRMYMRHVVGRTDLTNDVEMLNEFYRYYIDNNLRVQSRVFSYGTPAAGGSNIGTSQVLRLTKDRYNFDLEAQHIDAKRLRCVLDSNTGTDEGNEVWELKGQAVTKDDLQRSGSGLTATLAGLTTNDSLLSNAGFQSFSGTAAAPTAITDWSPQDANGAALAVNGTNFDFDSTNIYRVGPSDGDTTYVLSVKVTANLTQKLTVRNTELDANTPYLLVTIWNRQIGAASGTLDIRLGNVRNTVTVAAQTGWVVSPAPSAPSWASWYRAFQEEDLQLDLFWTRTGGTIRIAEALLLPGTFFDGSWYWVLPSSAATWVPPRIDDEHTWTDTATDAVIQRSLAFAWEGFYLPHANGSSITWTEP